MGSQTTNMPFRSGSGVCLSAGTICHLLILAVFVDVEDDLQNTDVGELFLTCSPIYLSCMRNAMLVL